MRVIPAQDSGPGKAHPVKGNPRKDKEFFLKLGPVSRAATKECARRS